MEVPQKQSRGIGRYFGRWLPGIFDTQEGLSDQDVERGIRMLTINGVCSMATGSLQGGIFLSAFALALGASNYEVGMLVTIGFVSQLMQIPGLYLVQKVRRRRGLTVVCSAISRLLWTFIILIPVLFAGQGISFLIQWLTVASLVMALCIPSWSSLLRAIVPQETIGKVFARRMAMGTGAALVLTLLGGYFVDWWAIRFPDLSLYAYSLLFLLGLIFAIVELFAIARLPEPHMTQGQDASLLELLAMPIRDGNFRQLMGFIAVWNFAVNMAAPFFIIYMLNRIGLSMFMVTVLAMVSQLTNLLFLRIWGRLADRYSNKAILSISGPLFLLAVLAWSFTTMPEQYFLTLPLLFLIHILSGLSLAGMNLGASNIALKLSPQGAAHAYMTAFGLAGSIAGALAPMAGGVISDFFATRELSLAINWSEPSRQISIYALNFKALDFLFGLAFLVGFVALNRLSRVTEEGQVTEGDVVDELVSEVVSPLRSLSTFAGGRFLTLLPLHMLWERGKAAPKDRDKSHLHKG